MIKVNGFNDNSDLEKEVMNGLITNVGGRNTKEGLVKEIDNLDHFCGVSQFIITTCTYCSIKREI